MAESSLRKKRVREAILSLDVLKHTDSTICFIGSMGKAQSESLSRLSDVDLLLIEDHTSLSQYVAHLNQAQLIAASLKKPKNEELFDIFMMSSMVAELHYSCLPVLAGSTTLDKDDLIAGAHFRINFKANILSNDFRQQLYRARANHLSRQYIQYSPVADTANARKVAKLILRILKLVICANSKVEDLNKIEKSLLPIDKLIDIESLFFEIVGRRVTIDPIIQQALEGKDINDWPAWMIAQDKLARQFLDFRLDAIFSVNDYLFYDTIAYILQDMLTLEIKNIIGTQNEKKRLALMEQFVNKAASCTVRLALAGVMSLANFDHPDTPKIVSKSYDVVVQYLRTGIMNMQGIAASVVLLEYALTQSFQIEN